MIISKDAIKNILNRILKLDKKVDSHKHNISDVNNLQTTLDSKASSTHNHDFNSLSNLPTTLSGYGITNAYTKTEINNKINSKTNVQSGEIITTNNDTIGYFKNIKIKGNTRYKKSDGTYTDTWESGVSLESMGEKEKNSNEKYPISVATCGKNLAFTATSSGNVKLNTIVDTNKLVVGKQYVISAKHIDTTKKVHMCFYKSDGTKVSNTYDASSPLKFTYSKDIDNITFSTEDVWTWCNVIDIQIEEGTIATNYEPYKEDKRTVLLDSPLRKVGTIADVLDLEKMKVTRKIKSITIDGTITNWVQAKIGNNSILWYITLNDAIPNTPSMCDKLKNDGTLWTHDVSGAYRIDENKAFQIRTDKTISNLSALTTWLQANPVTVVYQLATPTTKDIEVSSNTLTDFATSCTLTIDNTIKGNIECNEVVGLIPSVEEDGTRLANVEKILENKAEKNHNHDIVYVKQDGSTPITSRQQLKMGSYVFEAHAGNGTEGYALVAEFKISKNYQNSPIKIELARRGVLYSNITIQFRNTNSPDPTLQNFVYEGSDCMAYIVKADTSTWNLYIRKTEGYDVIFITKYSNPNSAITTIWKESLFTSLPDGGTHATPLQHSISEITNLQTTLDGKLSTDNGLIATQSGCIILSNTQGYLGKDKTGATHVIGLIGNDNYCYLGGNLINTYIRSKNCPQYLDSSGNKYNIYHSGNFNPSNYFSRSGQNTTNLNTCYDVGIYFYTDSTTGSPNRQYGHILNTVSDGNKYNGSNNWLSQLAFNTDDTIWHRSKVNSNGWTNWTKLVKTTDLNNYLPKSGGTMTGDLNSPAINLNNNCPLRGKETGGTLKTLIYMSDKNQVVLGSGSNQITLQTQTLDKLSIWDVGTNAQYKLWNTGNDNRLMKLIYMGEMATYGIRETTYNLNYCCTSAFVAPDTTPALKFTAPELGTYVFIVRCVGKNSIGIASIDVGASYTDKDTVVDDLNHTGFTYRYMSAGEVAWVTWWSSESYCYPIQAKILIYKCGK